MEAKSISLFTGAKRIPAQMGEESKGRRGENKSHGREKSEGGRHFTGKGRGTGSQRVGIGGKPFCFS